MARLRVTLRNFLANRPKAGAEKNYTFNKQGKEVRCMDVNGMYWLTVL